MNTGHVYSAHSRASFVLINSAAGPFSASSLSNSNKFAFGKSKSLSGISSNTFVEIHLLLLFIKNEVFVVRVVGGLCYVVIYLFIF